MKSSGWGRYPVIESRPLKTKKEEWWSQPFISQGNARSYGDAALSEFHLPTQRFNRFLAFDEQTGLLTCETGVLLADIIEAFLPRGWFLSVTPGSKLITIGGAIASDVHGKNHHVQGCFSQCVEWFDLLQPNGEEFRCSTHDNPELFHATCGGMGLTGVILRAAFYLKPVKSQWIKQTTVKTRNLKETFEAFENNKSSTYSVAWIDCLAKGEQLGRSLLMLGDFIDDGDLDYQPRSKITVPFDFPSFALNSFSVKAFNNLYYAKTAERESVQKVDIDTFFYPLDAIKHWNRIYGKKGFVQFQFILPKTASYDGLTKILTHISHSGMGSFLAVLKLYGAQNKNWLSFPMEGYSLALDFKIQEGLIGFLSELTDHVVDLGGRVYLAKDALLTKEQFEKSYPNTERFRAFRKKSGLSDHFQSLQSQRLGL
jgi:decaprenylphospho-beta-D-ribofuranose 2-oxidase